MPLKPRQRLFGDLLQGSRLFEEVTGTGNDYQLFRAGELCEGFPVHVDHRSVIFTDKQ